MSRTLARPLPRGLFERNKNHDPYLVKFFFWTFGFQLRFVLLFEWLTLFPKITRFPPYKPLRALLSGCLCVAKPRDIASAHVVASGAIKRWCMMMNLPAEAATAEVGATVRVCTRAPRPSSKTLAPVPSCHKKSESFLGDQPSVVRVDELTKTSSM